MAALADGDTPTRYQAIGAKWFIINLMDACWQFDPSKRPNFKYIKRELEDCAGHVLGLPNLWISIPSRLNHRVFETCM